MYKRKILELSVTDVTLDSRCAGRKRGKRMLVTRLVWPRPGISERVSMKILDFDADAATFEDGGWMGRILFKETVLGPFGVQAGISDELSKNEIGEFIRLMGTALTKVAGSEAGDLVEGSFGAGLASIPFQFLGKVISGSGKSPVKLVGEGQVALDASGPAWQRGKKVHERISLVAKERVYKTVKTRRDGELSARRRTVVKEGADVGSVSLSARLYE